jgi:hypothetical protein
MYADIPLTLCACKPSYDIIVSDDELYENHTLKELFLQRLFNCERNIDLKIVEAHGWHLHTYSVLQESLPLLQFSFLYLPALQERIYKGFIERDRTSAILFRRHHY